MTTEPVNRIIANMVVPSSPKYETNEARLPPPRPPGNMGQLRASNREIDDEMAMYSTVQSYVKKPKNFVANSHTGGKLTSALISAEK